MSSIAPSRKPAPKAPAPGAARAFALHTASPRASDVPARDDYFGRRFGYELSKVPASRTDRAAIQRKADVEVGAPGDPLEREADRVAEEVMRGARTNVRGVTGEAPVQRACAACTTPQATREAGTHVARALSDGGRPLPASARAFMEPRFGYDFSAVRVHTGPTAASAAAMLDARAFTIGRDVVFGAREAAPEGTAARPLLAHELAHVVQQGGATALADSAPAQLGSASPHIARMPDDDPVHTPIIEDYRHRHGLEGPDAVNGPSDAQIKYRLAPEEAARGEAAAIVAIAADTTRSIDDRAVAIVRAILDTYYGGAKDLVTDVRYDASDPGLTTTSVGSGATSKGSIAVGSYFARHTDRAGLARRVLQVGHELEHIRQYRRGMGGGQKRHEREFLAFHWEALAPARMGTGQVSHATRVSLIDEALRNYFCLTGAQQTQYDPLRTELLAARAREQAASGNSATPAPTTCPTP